MIPLGGKDDPVNEEGVQFYSDLIDECIRQGITPFAVRRRWSSCEDIVVLGC
jgi:beta-glucosidase